LRLIGPKRAEPILRLIEKSSKGLLFDCNMCGQCALSTTGMTCPMNCAKQMRNGPCGGVRADDMCEVDPSMRCVWVEATEGVKRVSADDIAHPTPLLPAIDVRKRGHSSWIHVIDGKPDAEIQEPVSERTVGLSQTADFERACRSDRLVVTVEVAPPDSADPEALIKRAKKFEGLVDGINITDGAGGNCHMSSVAASAILAANGFNPVYQVVCRDRNRIAIQGDILGAAALGVKNILCLTGDDVSQGDHPEAKPVFDLDAVSLLHVVRSMCDKGEFVSGRKLETPPDLFIGATTNPFVPPYLDRIANLEKKIDAGARFIQTQFCFDMPMFEAFMEEVRQRGLHKRAKIIVGVGTLGSAKALSWMAKNVPGVHIPEAIIARIAAADDQKEEAKQVCIETIQYLGEIEGVAGIHIMGHRNEDVLAEIIIESGVRQQLRLKAV
jgi:5,10-methylenetetrahydrofolate reductase